MILSPRHLIVYRQRCWNKKILKSQVYTSLIPSRLRNGDSIYQRKNTRGREAEIKLQSRKDHQEAWRRRSSPQQPCSYTIALRTQLLWYTSRAHWVGGSLSHSLLQFTMASFLCLGPFTLQGAPRRSCRPMYEFFILRSNLLLRLLLSLLIAAPAPLSFYM